jgi:hypothetical protein
MPIAGIRIDKPPNVTREWRARPAGTISVAFDPLQPEKGTAMLTGFVAMLAAFLAVGGDPAPASEVGALHEALSRCATGHALDLAVAKPGDGIEQIAETALQLCYQENMEAQNAFRAERIRADPSLPADELVALWDVRRAALRASLVAAVTTCRASIASGGRCPSS